MVTSFILNSHLRSLFSLTIYHYFPYRIETKVYATFVVVHVRSKSVKFISIHPRMGLQPLLCHPLKGTYILLYLQLFFSDLVSLGPVLFPCPSPTTLFPVVLLC